MFLPKARKVECGIATKCVGKTCVLTICGVRITTDGNHEPQINDRINRGRAAITKLNSILWDRDVTLKTKTRIYHAIVKSTITYAAETWCLKAKTVAKLNSTEMDFWRRSARISRKDKIRNTIIKTKMNVVTSLLDDIKTKQLQWYGHVQRMEEGSLPKEVMEWRPPGKRKRGRPKLTWAEGIREPMGGKGLMEEDWKDRSNWRRKIIKLSNGRRNVWKHCTACYITINLRLFFQCVQ